MPIVVGPERAGTAAGQIIAQSGLANLARQFQASQQAQQIQAQREAQLIGIGASERARQAEMEYRAGLQEQAAEARLEGLRFGAGARQEELQMRADLERQEAMRQEAREQEEKLWVTEFSPQSRQRLAKLNNSDQMIDAQVANGELDFATGQRMKAENQQERKTIIPQKRPRNSGDPPEYPQGQGVGQSWLDEDGNRHTREPGGKDVVQVPFEKTKAGIELKLQAEKEKAELDRQQERDDAIQAMRSKIALEREDVIGELGTKTGTRYLSPEKIEERLRIAYPELGDAAPGPEPWWVKLRKEGVDVFKIDKELPDRIGYAQAYLRHMRQKYGGYEGIPLYKRAAFDEQIKIYGEYMSKTEGGG